MSYHHRPRLGALLKAKLIAFESTRQARKLAAPGDLTKIAPRGAAPTALDLIKAAHKRPTYITHARPLSKVKGT